MRPNDPRHRRASGPGLALAVVAALVSAFGTVQGEPLTVDDAIKLRRAAFALQGQYFGQLKPMAAGAVAFDTRRADALVTRVTALSQMAAEFFPAGSDQGNTKASAAIWQRPDDFAQRERALQTELAALARSVQASDENAFKSAVATTSAACKACHEDFRAR